MTETKPAAFCRGLRFKLSGFAWREVFEPVKMMKCFRHFVVLLVALICPLSSPCQFARLNAYRDADGKRGLNGRILLMNNDNGENGVSYQGYVDNDPRKDGYWEYVNEDGALIYNLKRGTEFRYWAKEGERKRLLWHLRDCRHGNMFPKNGTENLSVAQNYLPWAQTSSRIDDRSGSSRKVTRSTVGWCVMQNSDRAEIVSSCYNEGIGTIYFDAVNGSPGMCEGECRIAVSIATNCIDGIGNSLPPTDENMGVAAVHWHRVSMIALKRDGTDRFVNEGATEEKSLCVRHGGTTNNFYRLYVPVDYRGPIRFRIERVGQRAGIAKDGDAMILIDNIIASYPAMRVELENYGRFDPLKTGKQTLGQEATWSVPFPSVADEEVYARVRARPYVNSAVEGVDWTDFIERAVMNYRWRYHDNVLGEWKSVDLDPADGLKSVSPLELHGPVGDIEYYYELEMNAPYYEYVDYSGTGLGVAWHDGAEKENGSYSEALALLEFHRSGGRQESCGTDWFVRLREGTSNYEAVDLVVRRGSCDTNGIETVIPMELSGNHDWRGFLKTVADDLSDVYFRIRFRNLQSPGTEVWDENVEECFTDAVGTDGRVDGYVRKIQGNGDWAVMKVDAKTGYLMFRVKDDDHSITVVHADYQNFNGWNDAKGLTFVGNTTDDGTKTGASGRQRECCEDFDDWKPTMATNKVWCVPTVPDLVNLNLGRGGDVRHAFEPFSHDDDNGWTIGPGMWVGRYYADQSTASEGKGVAIQMEGQGRGFLEFDGKAPRGLESVSFNARLGQRVDFNAFSYYDCGEKSTMSNYTFSSRVAFDLKKGLAFLGNASLSLAAYYRPGIGCYEARWEQIGGDWNDEGVFLGPNVDREKNKNTDTRYCQRLSLYRWNANGSGSMESKLLCSITNYSWHVFTIQRPTAITERFQPLFISVATEKDVTKITVGVGVEGMGLDETFSIGGKACDLIGYVDNSDLRLNTGTYGVLSANCEGVFAAPVFLDQPLRSESVSALEDVPTGGAGKAYGLTKEGHLNAAVSLTGKETRCVQQLDENRWVIVPGRLTYVTKDGKTDLGDRYRYLKADPAEQKLIISTAAATGKSAWKTVGEVTVDNFGQVGVTQKSHKVMLYTTEDVKVRISVGGSVDDVRNDVVIDTVELRQWRGDDYENLTAIDVPDYIDPRVDKGQANFNFTSCWIVNDGVGMSGDGSLLMSAKRSDPNRPCSILSPLFDGNTVYGRGSGLGMFSFSYKNAQPNVNLLVQIATNVSGRVQSYNLDFAVSDRRWITVTNFSFAGASDLAGGMRSCYIGLHGVQGVMRLVMDPAVVSDVGRASVVDPSQFGDIYITAVSCRDDPKLDMASWWGWNMRTIGQDEQDMDSEMRIYLPDLSMDPSAVGLSAALNNSIVDQVKDGESLAYRLNKPFIQTPTFAGDIVGEVSFKACKYDANQPSPAAVVLYGSNDGGENWIRLHAFEITNSWYASYSYKVGSEQAYKAFRFCVDGVEEVFNGGEIQPEGATVCQRVLLDELVVSEAIYARMGFRNVGAFRSALQTLECVPFVPSKEEQPLCGEGWGVQCEVYPAQLPEDLDLNREPEVYLHYYVGEFPWGYVNWNRLSGSRTVRLPMSSDSNLVFRSSCLGNYSNTIIPLSEGSEIVQYMLEVRFWEKGKTTEEYSTHFLEGGEWKTPDWYRPLDLNRENGTNRIFSAYTILDTVAPGWAWINEVNVFGDYDDTWRNSEWNAQFVEIAAPAEADMTGWSVQLIGVDLEQSVIVTNTIGCFGLNKLSGTKKNAELYAASNMVFRVLASPNASKYYGGRLDPENGELDRVWGWSDIGSGHFLEDGSINQSCPIAVRLMRPNGIVEHEIVCIGTNDWSLFSESYAPESVACYLKSSQTESKFAYVGDDCAGDGKSLGVFVSAGERVECWDNTMRMTPGRINEGQVIKSDHPRPNGEWMLVFANVDQNFGHVVQTIGDSVDTDAAVTVFLKRDPESGTNITYRVDAWFELDSVMENDVPIPFAAGPEKNTYVAKIGVGASGNVTVTAKAKLKESLLQCGLTSENPYTPAVMEWLAGHKNARGEDWFDPDADEVRLAQYVSMSGHIVTNLTLTEMYWLDMDPTVGNLALRAGMVKPAIPKLAPLIDDYKGTADDTNVEMVVYMMITNRTEDTSSKYYGYAEPPYVLRGLAPGETSWQYAQADWGWTSVTFKVAGILANGLTSEKVRTDWIPLRWFVFKEGSFVPCGQENEGTSVIQVCDPYSKRSPGYTAGWYSWKENHGEVPIFFSWALDTRIQPISVEILNPRNEYAD